MSSYPRPNSLFTLSPKHVKIKQRKNDIYALKTRSDTQHLITWFTDSPVRKTGKVPNDYFGIHFNHFFSESKPNASLNIRTNNANQNVIFEIKNASVRRRNNVDDVIYRIKPIGKDSKRTMYMLKCP